MPTPFHESGVVGNTTHEWREINLSQVHGPHVAIFAAMQSFNGADTAAPRLRAQTSFQVMIEEEKSRDPEIRHVGEQLGYLALRTGAILGDHQQPIGEVRTIEIRQQNANAWQTIKPEHSYKDPVVITQMMTRYGPDPAHIRLRNVSPASFDLQIEEWDYLDGPHARESVGYLIADRGVHLLDGGKILEIGSADMNHNWTTISLQAGFSSAPVVLSQCQTFAGPQAVVTRQRNVTAQSLQIRLQEEERNDGVHAIEKVGWLAIA